VIPYVYLGATVVLTSYGQAIVKWRVDEAGHLPDSLGAQTSFLLALAVDPWVLSAALAAFIAGLAWMAALTQLELSHAYPFVSVTFVLVLIMSALFFGESITVHKVAGMGLIVGGLIVGNLR
jgi:drug/metabolite transporter (DMT)-like permease